MLPAFKIRNLQRPATPPGHRSQSNPFGSARRDALIIVSEQEYDTNVKNYPESRLKYPDDDDGEEITVGTSSELSQRLAEPVPRGGPTRHRYIKSFGQVTSANQIPNMHTFDINQNAAWIWNEIERRTTDVTSHANTETAFTPTTEPTGSIRNNLSLQGNVELNHIPKTGGQGRSSQSTAATITGPVSDPIRLSRLEDLLNADDVDLPNAVAWENRRRHYFHTTKPPKVACEDQAADIYPSARQCTGMGLAESLNGVRPAKTSASARSFAAFGKDNLTAEGRREACEAGEKLRFRMTLQDKTTGMANRMHNRWASYHEVNSPSGAARTDHHADEPLEWGFNEAQAQGGDRMEDRERFPKDDGSLLQSFKAELAKLTNNKDSFETTAGTAQPIADDIKVTASHRDRKATATLQSSPEPVAGAMESSGPQNASHKRATEDLIDVTITKLLMQSLQSILSTVDTLHSQLGDSVLKRVHSATAATGVCCASDVPTRRQALYLGNALRQFTLEAQAPLWIMRKLVGKPCVGGKSVKMAADGLKLATDTLIRLTQAILDDPDASIKCEGNEARLEVPRQTPKGPVKEVSEAKIGQREQVSHTELDSCPKARGRPVSPMVDLPGNARYDPDLQPGPRRARSVRFDDEKDRTGFKFPSQSLLAGYRHVPGMRRSGFNGNRFGTRDRIRRDLGMDDLYGCDQGSGQTQRPEQLHKRRTMPNLSLHFVNRERSRSPISREQCAISPRGRTASPVQELCEGAVKADIKPQALMDPSKTIPPQGRLSRPSERISEALPWDDDSLYVDSRETSPKISSNVRAVRLSFPGQCNTSTSPSPIYPTSTDPALASNPSIVPFPSLPSMEPLEPSRPSAVAPEHIRPRSELPTDCFHAQESPAAASNHFSRFGTVEEVPNASMQTPMPNFSTRGVECRQSLPANELPATASGEDPGRVSVSPLSPRRFYGFGYPPELPTVVSQQGQQPSGVNRYPTTLGPLDRYNAENRRLVSQLERFNSISWEDFSRPRFLNRVSLPIPLHEQSAAKNFRTESPPVTGLSRMLRPPALPRLNLDTTNSAPGMVTRPSLPSMPGRPVSYVVPQEQPVPEHHDVSTAGAVERCVSMLKSLGFGTEKDGGEGRLVVYAQAANGVLGDSIDMIEEERRAWDRVEEETVPRVPGSW